MTDIVNGGLGRSMFSDRILEPPGLGALIREPLERKWDGMSGLLDRFGLGYVVFDLRQNVIGWNSVAKTKLNVPGATNDTARDIWTSFRRLTSNVTCKLQPSTLTWIVVAHRDGRPSVMHEKSNLVQADQSVVLLLDRDTRPHPNVERLQEMFGLTAAETQVLASIACGYTLLEIARNRHLSRTTIRSHLASLFAKTDTKRQSELVALVDSFAVLP